MAISTNTTTTKPNADTVIPRGNYRGKHTGKSYEPKNHWVVCDVCGFDIRAKDIRMTWDNRAVCPSDWEPRHPQDFVRSKYDHIRANDPVRPPPEDIFIDVQFTQDCPIVDANRVNKPNDIDLGELASGETTTSVNVQGCNDFLVGFTVDSPISISAWVDSASAEDTNISLYLFSISSIVLEDSLINIPISTGLDDTNQVSTTNDVGSYKIAIMGVNSKDIDTATLHIAIEAGAFCAVPTFAEAESATPDVEFGHIENDFDDFSVEFLPRVGCSFFKITYSVDLRSAAETWCWIDGASSSSDKPNGQRVNTYMFEWDGSDTGTGVLIDSKTNVLFTEMEFNLSNFVFSDTGGLTVPFKIVIVTGFDQDVIDNLEGFISAVSRFENFIGFDTDLIKIGDGPFVDNNIEVLDLEAGDLLSFPVEPVIMFRALYYKIRVTISETNPPSELKIWFDNADVADGSRKANARLAYLESDGDAVNEASIDEENIPLGTSDSVSMSSTSFGPDQLDKFVLVTSINTDSTVTATVHIQGIA